jgi:hypothetical protein
MNAMDHYIADSVFPIVFVEKQSDIYPVYTRGFFFADEGERMARAPGTTAAVSGWELDNTNTYRAINYAIGVEIPDEVRSNSDAVFNLDNDATQLVTHLQMIRRERAFAADFMTTGVWGTDVTGTTNFTKWSDYGGSDPLTDLEDGLDTVEGNTGSRPNKLILGAIGWRRLKHHPDLVDRVSGGATTGNPAIVQRQLLASLIGVDQVLVGRASFRSSAEGATLTMARIIDDDALLLYTPPNPSLMTPAAGYTYIWRTRVAPSAVQYMRKGRMERERKDWIESHSYFDQVATETESGYFFSDAVD